MNLHMNKKILFLLFLLSPLSTSFLPPLPSPPLTFPPTSAPSWVGCCRVYFAWGVLLLQSVFFWFLLSYVQQYTLKGLLMYKGWMFDPRGWVESNSHCEKFVCWELSAVYLHRVQCRTAPSLYSIFPPLLLLLPCFTSSLNLPLLSRTLYLPPLPLSPPSPSSLITANSLWLQRYGLSSLSSSLAPSNRCFSATRGRCQHYQCPDWRTPADG